MRLETKVVKRIDPEKFGDGKFHLQTQARCPKCGVFGDVEGEQLAGHISLVCGNDRCDWHGYIDGREV